jgi:hypothetical protein
MVTAAFSAITAICFESPWKTREASKSTAAQTNSSAGSQAPKMLCGQLSRHNGRLSSTTGRASSSRRFAWAFTQESLRSPTRAISVSTFIARPASVLPRKAGKCSISETTHNVLADTVVAGVSFTDLGEHDLKGLPRPERIFQLVVDGLESEFTPLRGGDIGALEPGAFEGRERELAETAVGRLRQALSGLRSAGGTGPDLEELGWQGQGASASDEAGRPEGAGRARQRLIYKRTLSGPG